mmetsp:Transcript_24614/g.53087  ORF Transcript_24614/g.53087 Transcript_24614/m.53087 type:complete len:203 (-) Transcript_24614:937-1545(-)
MRHLLHRCHHGVEKHVDGKLLLLVVEEGARLGLVTSHIRKARTTAGHHALCDAADERIDRVLVPQLLVQDLGLGGAANLDPSNRATQLRDALLQPLDLELFVRLAKELLHLPLEHLHRLLNRCVLCAVRHKQRLLLANHRARDLAQVGKRCILQLEPKLTRDESRSSEGADVLQKPTFHVPKPWRLDGARGEHTPLQVKDEA